MHSQMGIHYYPMAYLSIPTLKKKKKTFETQPVGNPDQKQTPKENHPSQTSATLGKHIEISNL